MTVYTSVAVKKAAVSSELLLFSIDVVPLLCLHQGQLPHLKSVKKTKCSIASQQVFLFMCCFSVFISGRSKNIKFCSANSFHLDQARLSSNFLALFTSIILRPSVVFGIRYGGLHISNTVNYNGRALSDKQ